MRYFSVSQPVVLIDNEIIEGGWYASILVISRVSVHIPVGTNGNRVGIGLVLFVICLDSQKTFIALFG